MKLGYTINLGHYESLRIDSSEHDTIEECVTELYEALSKLSLNNPAIMTFLSSKFPVHLTKKQEG